MSARTTFIPKRGLAIVTNTKDNFITVINTKTHKKIKDINVTSGTINTDKDKILQSVTTFGYKHPF
jgi:YVTN family beta-propeller protein